MPERRRQTKSRIDVDLVIEGGDWPDPDDLETLIQVAASEVAAERRFELGKASVAVALANDGQVTILNGQFRGKTKATNVLSFPSGAGSQAGFLGDIVLAFETVAREAIEQDVSLEHHVQHLVVHGILHLLGLDHETSGDAELMEVLEIQILSRIGVANPYTGALDRDK